MTMTTSETMNGRPVRIEIAAAPKTELIPSHPMQLSQPGGVAQVRVQQNPVDNEPHEERLRHFQPGGRQSHKQRARCGQLTSQGDLP